MTVGLDWPWVECAILTPLLGACLCWRSRDADRSRQCALGSAILTLVLTTVVWLKFIGLESQAGQESFGRFLHRHFIFVDELSAILLPLAALIYFLTILATMRTKVRRFSFTSALIAESILLATLCCDREWTIVLLLIVGVIPPYLELRERGKPIGVFTFHMGIFALLLLAGQSLISNAVVGSTAAIVGVLCLSAAVLLRTGIVPLHCWLTDLFEHASFGGAMLFATPMVGAYAAIRLVLPIAPLWVLNGVANISLITAVYASGMALVQVDSRRFFAYLFLSHASLVLVGLELATPLGLTGALCTWIAVELSLTGLGLTLRSVESRIGRLLLDRFHGLYEHIPTLAILFLLTGLASIGFPGTLGFVGAELLIESAVRASPMVGLLVVIAAALNGVAILKVFFRVFTGQHHIASVNLHARPRERYAVILLTVLILGGGLYPQPGVTSRYHAARQLTDLRAGRGLSPVDHESHGAPIQASADVGVSTPHRFSNTILFSGHALLEKRGQTHGN